MFTFQILELLLFIVFGRSGTWYYPRYTFELIMRVGPESTKSYLNKYAGLEEECEQLFFKIDPSEMQLRFIRYPAFSSP